MTLFSVDLGGFGCSFVRAGPSRAWSLLPRLPGGTPFLVFQIYAGREGIFNVFQNCLTYILCPLGLLSGKLWRVSPSYVQILLLDKDVKVPGSSPESCSSESIFHSPSCPKPWSLPLELRGTILFCLGSSVLRQSQKFLSRRAWWWRGWLPF